MSGPSTAAPTAPANRSREPARPVAVVWCRQVDNEAESPGYMTVPESFPGYSETLETIRAVGHLTINVADTSDYWDPDPSQTLAYYPNLFLYPAFDGQYTCVGRMFLSREDRPRLGMKTLVLPTSELLNGDGFGPAVLHWYSSMGGPRRGGGRPGASPEPRLYDVVAEGFFFHLGSTDPVLLLAAGRWEPTMQVVLHLLRELPSSLLALSTILAFPYFLPSGGSELKELERKMAVSLVLMRLPPSEAQGEIHEKRVGGWQSSGLTVHDLTAEPLPGDAGKSGAASPLVIRYVRDRDVERLAELRTRVDFVELPGTKSHFTDPEFLDGRRRRKEAWRIGTAMENAALLMSRPRGRQLLVESESARRAQEYLDAESRPAPPGAAAPHASPADAASAPAGAEATAARDPDARAADAVPVPTRVDPVSAGMPTRVSWLAVPGSGDWTVLDERTIRRIVGEEYERRRPGSEAPQRLLAEEISRSISLGVAAAREQLENEFAARLAGVEERLQRMGGRPVASTAPALPPERLVRDLDERFRRFSDENRTRIASELDRRLDALAATETEARASLESRLLAAGDARHAELQASIERLATEEGAQLSELVVKEAEALRAASQSHDEAQRAESLRTLEARLRGEVDGQVREAIAPQRAELAELARRVETTLAERGAAAAASEGPRAEAAAPAAVAPGPTEEVVRTLRSSVDDLEASREELSRRIEEVDTRTQSLVERLVPLVREALVKIAAMRPAMGSEGATPDAGIAELRRETQRESQRIEAELQLRINDLRRHVETSLGHQSRVWLTLIQQLSTSSGERLLPPEGIGKDPGSGGWEEPDAAESLASDAAADPPTPARKGRHEGRSTPKEPDGADPPA